MGNPKTKKNQKKTKKNPKLTSRPFSTPKSWRIQQCHCVKPKKTLREILGEQKIGVGRFFCCFTPPCQKLAKTKDPKI